MAGLAETVGRACSLDTFFFFFFFFFLVSFMCDKHNQSQKKKKLSKMIINTPQNEF